MVQLVECLLAKEKVVGSSPIARSDKPLKRGFYFGLWEAVHSYCPSKVTSFFFTSSLLLDHPLTF